MINRRKFLINSTATGLVLGSFGLASCQPAVKPASGIAEGTEGESSADVFELNEITIDELQQKMERGDYSSRSVTELYLKRIDAIDKNGYALNASNRNKPGCTCHCR